MKLFWSELFHPGIACIILSNGKGDVSERYIQMKDKIYMKNMIIIMDGRDQVDPISGIGTF